MQAAIPYLIFDHISLHSLSLSYTHSQSYTVTLTASYEGSSGKHSQSVTLTAVGSPLAVNLTGPSGTIPLKGGNLVYDARGSVDPDDPFNTASQLSYLWSCTNTEDLTPCFGKQVDGTWVLDSTQVRLRLTGPCTALLVVEQSSHWPEPQRCGKFLECYGVGILLL